MGIEYIQKERPLKLLKIVEKLVMGLLFYLKYFWFYIKITSKLVK